MNLNSKNFLNYKLFQFSNESKVPLNEKIIINTINAHSFNIARKNEIFEKALQESDILLPDGVSIVWSSWFLNGIRIRKIAGAQIFNYLINELNEKSGKCFFLGSSDKTLEKIRDRLHLEFPNVKVEFHSPPFKKVFNHDDNKFMLKRINDFKPDVLFLGMTAPKQEIWIFENKDQIQANIKCGIGAVFDFYAGNIKRAPKWIVNIGLEWFYRLIKEPHRMWKRYIIGNLLFVYIILKEKCKMKASRKIN